MRRPPNYLVIDYNGALACNDILLERVTDRLAALARQISVYILTADTLGTAGAVLAGGST